MIQLPQEFSERMREQLGGEFEPFLQSYREEGYAGLRVNTQKISVESFLAITPFHLTPVPWTDNGFYYQKEEAVTRHPHYYAGLYYIQEPSAMLPAAALPVTPGDMVLDLCAAPGGKATELSLRLQGKGILVANDVSPGRAKALLKNLTLWGAQNCCITAETPQRLLNAFGCFFDKVLVDAPCSGEGMFRRDTALVAAWKEKGPSQYTGLQKEILSCAVRMLKPGGSILYSTCTFSEAEDEEVIETILHRYPELTLAEIPMADGFAPGKAPCESCVRIWPHHVKGEGHFAALLHKQVSGQKDRAEKMTAMTAREKKQGGAWQDIPPHVLEFLRMLPESLWKGRIYRQIGEQCLLLPFADLPKGLRCLRTGILVGTLRHGRFEPSQALAMLLDAKSYPYTLNLSSQDPRTMRYLKGETIGLDASDATVPKGYVLVCVDGFALGWGKYVDGRVRNKYYPGWRMQSAGYTTKERQEEFEC